MRNAVTMGIALSVLGALAQPSFLAAQAPAYFQALSIPPRAVGTCVEQPRAMSNGARLRIGTRLLMTYRDPGARRELSLLRDSAGTVAGFNDAVYRSTGLLSNASENVVATLRRDGSATGYLMRSTTQMSGNSVAKFDSASLRRMREGAKRTSSRDVLDGAAQRKVQELVAWLAKRCSA